MKKIALTSKVAAPADQLWQAIGSFHSIGDWHPMIARVEAQGKGKGTRRVLHLRDGTRIVEQLTKADDKERRYTYTIVDSPLPLSRYAAKVHVRDDGDGTSTVEWSGEFEVKPQEEANVARQFQAIYQAGLDQLAKLYGGKG
jgi:mxaD protein